MYRKVLFFFLITGLVASGLWVYKKYFYGLPEVPSYSRWVHNTPKATLILSAEGKIIGEVFLKKLTVIPPESLPSNVMKAVLGAEDSHFFQHGPVSIPSILRALFIDILYGEIRQGGSSISQQTAKLLFLKPERTLHRKVKELILAYRLEHKMTKREILSVYVSSVYLGHGNYGFEEAARYYFHCSAGDLNLAQAAMLAGIIASPEKYNPLTSFKEALRRQHVVLKRMVHAGLITKQQYHRALSQVVHVYREKPLEYQVSEYPVALAIRKVKSLFPHLDLSTAGLRVYTTIRVSVQSTLQWAVLLELARYFSMGRFRPCKHCYRVRCLRKRGVWIAVKGEKRIEIPFKWAPRVFLPGTDPCNIKEMEIAGIHKEGKRLVGMPVLGPQVGVAVVNPDDFGVEGLIGGEDFEASRFDRSVAAYRPVGSVVKPFIFALALQKGAVSPHDTFPNVPVSIPLGWGRVWRPSNFEGFDGKLYSLKEALAHSINVIAVQILRRLGVKALKRFFEDLPLRGRVPSGYSIALGSLETSPVEITAAMAVFANQGMYDRPHILNEVRTWDGRQVYVHKVKKKQVLSEWVTRLVRSYMKAVVQHGTARNLSSLKGIWGKTGTTNSSREAWFVGYCDGRVGGFYVGFDDRRTMKGATGGNTAAPIFGLWCTFLKKLP